MLALQASSKADLSEVFPEAWIEVSLDKLNKLTARLSNVCKAITARNEECYEESWKTNIFMSLGNSFDELKCDFSWNIFFLG